MVEQHDSNLWGFKEKGQSIRAFNEFNIIAVIGLGERMGGEGKGQDTRNVLLSFCDIGCFWWCESHGKCRKKNNRRKKMKIPAEPDWPNGYEHCATTSSVGHGFDPPLINTCGYMICKSTWAEKGLDAHVGCQEVSKQESMQARDPPYLEPHIGRQSKGIRGPTKCPSNKTVLLLERKRHTAHCVPSTPVLSYPGGYPIPGRGVTPILTWPGHPPERTWDQWKYYGVEIGQPPLLQVRTNKQTNRNYYLAPSFRCGR